MCKDGTQLYTRLVSAPMVDDKGGFRGSMFSVTDISERLDGGINRVSSIKE